MSDALDYLLKVRPEAMEAYFEFVRASGRHLDGKTRALISVITKVDNQTESGFRQYLNRALRAGVTADEILDALLSAFPTLGLSKIVWAMDILLDMDIPEFRPENLGRAITWHDVIAEQEVRDSAVMHARCDGRELFIFRAGVEFRVYDNRCPHQATHIPRDALAGYTLTCPRHGWKFDVQSGACIERGDRPLTRFEHKVENGRLLVRW
ncbi:MAG: Rieske 2Fe-2S domain-containing protein [Gammaproteobacteria bacterium]|nr:Rieske 2Fe-2S domain-containing protein [Gammaproteobacteria bacterium]